MLRKFFRTVFYLICSILLASCAATSPKMSQELEQGKVNFIAGNYKAAFHELLPVAGKGNAQAEYAVGYMYYYGYGVSQDSESGIFWMQKAANQNFEPAIKALDVIHRKAITENGNRNNYKKFKKVAENNNDEGYVDLTLNAVHGPLPKLSQQEDEVTEVMMEQANNSIKLPAEQKVKPTVLKPVQRLKVEDVKPRLAENTSKPVIKKSDISNKLAKAAEAALIKKPELKMNHLAASNANQKNVKPVSHAKLTAKKGTCYWGRSQALQQNKLKLTRVHYIDL